LKAEILPRDFYLQPVQQAARNLLGQRLVRTIAGQRAAGIILETEAYDGEQDQACHARSGLTERNRMMYESGGRAYVYFTYGMHWMLNCVCAPAGYPAAVLIRAILPTENLDFFRHKREGVPEAHWCDGPAKLTKALEIDRRLNGADLCDPASGLIIEKGLPVPDELVEQTPRIGIQYSGEPWVSLPWRYFVSAKAWRSMPGI
jgi:DNA-3-methyladenine glycosylase (3mg)